MMAKCQDVLYDEIDAQKAYTIQRTKAIPKNSLFGTTLENADREAAHAINTQEYDTENNTQRRIRATQYDHRLPSRLQNKDEKDKLTLAQDEITKKKQQLTERQIAVADMENRAKYYASIPSPLKQDHQLKKKMLLADPGLDFELTKKMNDIGYAEKNSFNKDKHRPRPPVHQYSIIGDPLEYGMDFSLHQTETKEKYAAYTLHRPDNIRYYRSLRQHKSAPLVEERGSIPPMLEERGSIPANIRAMYGSKLVDELFSDKLAVGRVRQRIDQDRIRKQMRPEKVELPQVDTTTPKNYGDLSHALRQDKFGGYSFLNASLMKDSHTQEVFDRRYKDPDEYRHTWDEYGKWKEKELCREKMDRDYEEFLQALPKLAANWDRNAVAPPKTKDILQQNKPTRKPKPRKRAAPNQPVKPTKEPLFDDVVFISPPKTPEPQVDSIIPVSSVSKRDDEFWNFYDQGLPSV